MKWARRLIFSLTSLASVCAGAYFSFYVSPAADAMTGIWLGFALITFLFGWPEVAESVSFLGNSIKLREVKSAIKELKQLAEVNSRAILELIQCSNRWSGFSESERLGTYTAIEKMLKNLEFSDEEINAIQERWHYWVNMDYLHALMHNSNINHPEIPSDNHKEWHRKREEIYARRDSITPDEVKEVFDKLGGCTEKIKKAIEDWKYYLKNKKHRDIGHWEKHNNWFEK